MSTSTEVRVSAEASTDRFVIVADECGLALSGVRLVDRLGARIFAGSLDAELAAGLPPEGRRMRAVRAGVLVRPRRRKRLADAWCGLLARCSTAQSTPLAALPPRRAAVLHARDLIVELADRLSAASPVPPSAVAMARLLLTDGTGPVYRTTSPESLQSAVAAVVRELATGCGLTRDG